MKVKRRDEDEYDFTPQFLEDLWYLSKILEVGDVASGTSFRRFKSQDAENDSGEKKKVHLTLQIEQVEFAESANKLRLTGKILGGTPEEFVQVGAHHTLDVEVNRPFTLKKRLNAYHRSVIEEAKKKAAHVKASILVMDEHKALLAELQTQGVKFLFEVTNHANKRNPEKYDSEVKAYYAELLKAIEGKEKIIAAGPGFAKDEFKKYVQNKNPALLERVGFEHTNDAEKTGVYELIKRGLIDKILGEQKASAEYALLEELKKHLAKEDGLAVYGLDDVGNAVQANAVSDLLVTDELIRKDKGVGRLAEEAESKGAALHVFDGESQQGAELKSFGIAALLRYQLR